MTRCIKNIVVLAVVFFMQFANLTHASTSVGGWNVGSAVAQGATTVFTAVKNGATAVAKIRPTPEQVARGALRGAMGGLLLTVAQDLIENGVGFVIDSATNSLKYTDLTAFDWKANDMSAYSANTPYAACALAQQYYGGSDKAYFDGSRWVCPTPMSGINMSVFKTPKTGVDSQKSIPLTQIASQALDSADSGNKDAQALTTAVAQTATATNTDDQIVPAAQLSQALDITGTGTASDPFTSPSTPVTGDGTKDNPYTNTKPQDQSQTQTDNPASTPTASPMPAKDVPTDCAFFQTACTWFDWTKKQYTDVKTVVTDYFKDPDQTDKDTTVDDDAQAPTLKTDYIKFSETCPFSSKKDSITIGDQTTEIQSDFSDACKTASDMRPFVILLGSLISFGICCGFNFAGSAGED